MGAARRDVRVRRVHIKPAEADHTVASHVVRNAPELIVETASARLDEAVRTDVVNGPRDRLIHRNCLGRDLLLADPRDDNAREAQDAASFEADGALIRLNPEPFERFRRASACDLVESARDEIAKEISDSFEPGCVSCVRRVVISVVVGRSGQARERINAQELRRRRVLGPRPAPGLL